MLTETQVKEIEALAKKNDAVAEMLSEWKRFTESPYADSYITLYNQLTDWNAQLEIREINTPEGKRVVGMIDIFSDKDSKEFDRAFKYFTDITKLLDILDAIRGKMTPSEQKEVSERVAKNKSIAV
jgi:hypothetical protein